jgi:hypothetical protein
MYVMDFYPVYKICSISGSFTRIGSLMEPCHPWGIRTTPHQRNQARSLFAQRSGDIILLGPRCAASAGEAGPERGRKNDAVSCVQDR